MATAARDGEPGDTECSVCSDPYTDPKLLLCGHLLCRQCLLTWASSNKDAQCPLCRSAMLDGAQGTSTAAIESYVDGLTTDIAMKNLANAQRILTKQHTCCACDDVAASTICITCHDMLCASCTKVHGKLSATKHHRVASLTSVMANELATGEPSYCPAHVDEPSKVFCKSHGAAICVVCATTDHKQCTVIKEESRAEEAHAVLREVISELRKGESDIEKAVEELDAEQKKAQQVTERALQQGLQLCDRLDSFVQKGRQRLTDLARAAGSDSEQAVKKARALLLSRKGRLTTHRQVAARADQLQTSADLTGMAGALKARLTNHLDCSPVLPSEAAVAMTTLVVNTETLERFLQQELWQLDSVTPRLLCHCQMPQFTFHANHGKDIVLRDGGQAAEKQGNSSYAGILMSNQQMEINYLYQVEVRSLSQTVEGNMLILPGLVTESPDQLTLPGHAFSWKSAIVVGFRSNSISGSEVNSSFGHELLTLTKGSRVGVSLDDSRKLLVHRDGRCLGTVTEAPLQPVYALFDIRKKFKCSVAALPPTYLK